MPKGKKEGADKQNTTREHRILSSNKIRKKEFATFWQRWRRQNLARTTATGEGIQLFEVE